MPKPLAAATELEAGLDIGAERPSHTNERLGYRARNLITQVGIDGAHLNDPAGADPGFCDVLRCLSGPQLPADLTAVAFLMTPHLKRDLALCMNLAEDL